MKLSEAVQHPLVQRAAIVLYIVCVIGVISAYIGISTVDVRQALYFQGDKVLQSGATHVVRGAFVEARIGQFAHPSDFQFSITPPGAAVEKGTLVGRGKSGAGGFAHIGLDIPADQAAGKYDLVLKADHAELGTYEARQPVEIVAASAGSQKWPIKTERADVQQLASKQAEAKRNQAMGGKKIVQEGVLIDVLPADHEIVRGLPNTIFFRTRDAQTQAPVSARLTFQSSKGHLDGALPAELKTDRIGLASVQLTPITDQVWQMEAETADGAKSEAEVKLVTVAAQFSVQVKQPIVVTGKPIDGAVYSLFEAGAFFVDVYQQDRRVAASALGLQAGGSGFVVELPADSVGSGSESSDIYRLQIYGDFYNPANAWDSVYIARTQDSSLESLRETAIRTVRFVGSHSESVDAYYSTILADQMLESATEAELNRWMPAFLQVIPRHFEASPTLFNTQHADRAELELWKASVKSDLKLLVGFVLLIGIVALFYFTMMGIQQVRARSRRIYEVDAFDEEGRGEGDYGEYGMLPDGLESSRMSDFSVAMQGGLLLLSIVLFAVGVWVLIGYL